jgi:hypothetical protein
VHAFRIVASGTSEHNIRALAVMLEKAATFVVGKPPNPKLSCGFAACRDNPVAYQLLKSSP